MIELKNIIKSYKNTAVLKGLSLKVEKGEIYGFIGKNGAGKTTTMNIITGLLKYDGGQILLNGEKNANCEKFCGYLPEDPKFYPYMTVTEYLRLLGDINKQSALEATKRIDYLLEIVDLTADKNKRIGKFSRGMRQRVGLAACMYNDPEVLILDEPSSALDPAGRADVVRLLLEINKMGKTIFLSSHILNDLEHICDKVGILADGSMALEDNIGNILDRYAVPAINVKFDETVDIEKIQSLINLPFVKSHTIDDENNLMLYMEKPKENINIIYSLLPNININSLSVAVSQANLDDVFEKVAMSKEVKNG